MTNVLLPAEALLPTLAAEYALDEPLACHLIRRGFNDHYRVRAGAAEYVLRL